MQKHPKERRKRLKFYSAAVDLLRNTTNHQERVVDGQHEQHLPETLATELMLCLTPS